MDLSFAQHCQGRRPQRQPIAFKFKVSLLFRPNPVWKPAQLEAMNDRTLLFVDLVGAAVADVSLEAALDLLRCGLGQVVGGKVRAIRTHESNAHWPSRIVHDAPSFGPRGESVRSPLARLIFHDTSFHVPKNCSLTEREAGRSDLRGTRPEMSCKAEAVARDMG